MPAGAVGSVWDAGTWTNTCWEANTWDTATAYVSLYRNDLTAAVMDAIQLDRDATLREDSTTILMGDSGIYKDARVAEANNDDINAALWLYLTW